MHLLSKTAAMCLSIGTASATTRRCRSTAPIARRARIELQVALKDNQALCTYGGAAKTSTLDAGADYLM